MSKEELPSLDWIATNVMGWKPSEEPGFPRGPIFVRPDGSFILAYDLPDWTGQDAMEVLEKCLEKLAADVVFFKSTDKPGMFRVFRFSDVDLANGTKFVEADTLPAAICAFAKVHFSK